MALVRLAGVNTDPAYELSEVKENVCLSLKRPYPWLHQLPEFMKNKKGHPIALVGGGPSLREHLDELRQFDVVMAVGSSHDFLMQEGVKVRYCIAVDAHPTVVASYLKRPHVQTNYLVASQCHPSVFEALDGYQITLWHCLAKDSPEWLTELDPGYQGLGGGCTAGMRAFGMALCFGYRDLHLFGYDSCLSESGEGHAYPLQDEEEENTCLAVDVVFHVAVGGPDDDVPSGQRFACYGYHLAQAQNFEEFFRHHHAMSSFTFHGGGLMRHVHETMLREEAKAEFNETKAA